MTQQWLETLGDNGAIAGSAADSVTELKGYTTAMLPQLSALSDHSAYEITGEDATAFLQGQFCNDLAKVSATQAQITGYCTPKGRLLALPTIVGWEGGYRLIVPNSVAEAFIKRLTMFVMRSKVTIKPLEDWAVVGITATPDGNLGKAGSIVGPLPSGDDMAVSTSEDAQLIRCSDDLSGVQPRARYLRVASIEAQLELWNTCDDAEKRSANAWRLADVSAGVPSIKEGVVESFVPQMINLQLINGLSFTKGCYPGQEIVARMQYLGKLKRHMRVFSLAISDQPFSGYEHVTPGAALVSGTDQNAGIVVDAMPTSEGEILVLAVTKVTATDEPFLLAEHTLAPRPMPYELPSMEVA